MIYRLLANHAVIGFGGVVQSGALLTRDTGTLFLIVNNILAFITTDHHFIPHVILGRDL